MANYRKIFSRIALIISVAILLPATVAYFFGLVVVVIYSIPITGSVNIDTGWWLLWMALCGYGLYSLWWLLLKFKFVSFPQIPVYIKIGLGLGVLISVGLTAPFAFMGYMFASRDVSKFHFFSSSFIFSAPLLIAIILLALALRKK